MIWRVQDGCTQWWRVQLAAKMAEQIPRFLERVRTVGWVLLLMISLGWYGTVVMVRYGDGEMRRGVKIQHYGKALSLWGEGFSVLITMPEG